MYGEPFADSSQIPTYLVSHLTRQSVTVALSGDGGDELFVGYSSYQRLAKAQKMLELIPSSVYAMAAQLMRLQLLQRLIHSRFGDQRYEWAFNALRLLSGSKESWIPRGLHAKLSLPERLVLGAASGDSIHPYRRCQGNITEQMMSHDTSIYLPDDILTKVDQASMAVSLEVRAPFADDWRLFEAAWKIPFRHKVNKFGGKLVLKSALERHVPRTLFDRPKKGFAVPLGRWLNGPLNDWVLACTDPARIRREGYLDSQEIENLVRNAKSGDEWYAYKLWAVCLFQCWLDGFHGGR
jgi:asparagine synthase (glutamine-hydrolysing)